MKSVTPKSKTFVGQASIAKRALAFLVDIAIVSWLILWPFGNIVDKLMPANSFSDALKLIDVETEFSGSLAVATILISALTILYFLIFEKKFCQSPGKMIFNLY